MQKVKGEGVLTASYASIFTNYVDVKKIVQFHYLKLQDHECLQGYIFRKYLTFESCCHACDAQFYKIHKRDQLRGKKLLVPTLPYNLFKY